MFSVTQALCVIVCNTLHESVQQTVNFVNNNMVDEATKRALAQIPLLKTKAGPRDGELWVQRLKEEYQSLIKVVKNV